LPKAVKFDSALSDDDWKGKRNSASVFYQLKVKINWQHLSMYLKKKKEIDCE